jgi:hypothetical protein
MFKNKVLGLAMAGAAATGALAFAATAQAEASPATVTPSPTAIDALSDCTLKPVFHSASVTCTSGSGSVRVGLECELFDGSSKVIYGYWVGVNQTSYANCQSLDVMDRWYETA